MGEHYFKDSMGGWKIRIVWIVWEGGKLGTRTDSGFQIHSTDFGIPAKNQNICLVSCGGNLK